MSNHKFNLIFSSSITVTMKALFVETEKKTNTDLVTSLKETTVAPADSCGVPNVLQKKKKEKASKQDYHFA